MMLDGGRPGDERGFIHKKIGGFVGSVARTGLGLVGAAGIPGFSAAARLTSSFIPGGSRNRSFLTARSAQLARGRAEQRFIATPRRVPPGLPQSNQMRTPSGGFIAPQMVQAGQAQEILATSGECPRGFHRNKSTYRLVTSGELVMEGTRCVRNRRRNPDNGRASLRAARRLLARQKHAKTIDDALRSLAPRKSSRRSAPAPARGGPIVVAS